MGRDSDGNNAELLPAPAGVILSPKLRQKASLSSPRARGGDPIIGSKDEGKSPFSLDSKAPTGDYKAFMMREIRYNSLMRANPDRATVLFDKSLANSKAKYDHLVEMQNMYKNEFEK